MATEPNVHPVFTLSAWADGEVTPASDAESTTETEEQQ